MSHDPNDPLAPFRREPRPVASAPEQNPLTERQALKLAMEALAEVPDHRPELMFDLQEAYRNGVKGDKLREAAPEMLEALKASREMFYTLGDKDTQESKDCFALYEICDAALAKAMPEPQRQLRREASDPQSEQDSDLEPDF